VYSRAVVLLVDLKNNSPISRYPEELKADPTTLHPEPADKQFPLAHEFLARLSCKSRKKLLRQGGKGLLSRMGETPYGINARYDSPPLPPISSELE
jgi:hypothetical protein